MNVDKIHVLGFLYSPSSICSTPFIVGICVEFFLFLPEESVVTFQLLFATDTMCLPFVTLSSRHSEKASREIRMISHNARLSASSAEESHSDGC